MNWYYCRLTNPVPDDPDGEDVEPTYREYAVLATDEREAKLRLAATCGEFRYIGGHRVLLPVVHEIECPY